MSYDADLPALHAELFAAFGVQCTLTSRDGEVKSVLVVLDEVTHNVGDLGGLPDPRPSVKLSVVEVGNKPRGTIQLGARSFELDRNVDADNDAYVVRVFVRELPAT